MTFIEIKHCWFLSIFAFPLELQLELCSGKCKSLQICKSLGADWNLQICNAASLANDTEDLWSNTSCRDLQLQKFVSFPQTCFRSFERLSKNRMTNFSFVYKQFFWWVDLTVSWSKFLWVSWCEQLFWRRNNTGTWKNCNLILPWPFAKRQPFFKDFLKIGRRMPFVLIMSEAKFEWNFFEAYSKWNIWLLKGIELKTCPETNFLRRKKKTKFW